MSRLVALAAAAFGALAIVACGSAWAAPGLQALAVPGGWLLGQEMTGLGAGLAAGLGVVGAGIGIGRIGGSSVEAIARQPEMAGRIFINMILTAALVEGVALFSVIVGVLALNKV